ncbi:MAG: VOC family protein [Pseudomonadota bacterium]
MTDQGFSVRALGEIAIRCTDFDAMVSFYEDTLGLQRLTGNQSGAIVFFQLGESWGGHTAVLALFGETDPARTDGSGGAEAGGALHHVALVVPPSEQDTARLWLESRGHETHYEEFPWIGWRGLFTKDPDGNTVELVAHMGGS